MQSRLTQFLIELSLWLAASATCTGAGLGVSWLALELIGPRHPVVATIFFAVPAVLTSTWGAWISLNWTRGRVLRVVMKGVTLSPGLALLVVGGLGAYFGFASRLAWIAWVASSVGTLAVTVLMWRYFGRASVSRHPGGLLVGLTVYPLATAATAGLVAYLWFWFVAGPDAVDLGPLPGMRLVATTVLGAELVTTALPALFSAVSSEAARQLRRAFSGR